MDTVFSRDVATDYPDYLRDESRRGGGAASISFPRTEEEVREHVLAAAGQHLSITTQGARTGITGGAVPDGGHILNLSRLAQVGDVCRTDNGGLITVGPGVILADLRERVARQTGGELCFPPDPTETSASVGGMAACNASGARTFFYGSTRAYIDGLRAVLADGSTVELARGRERADGRHFTLRTTGGGVFEGMLPSYAMPGVKNAAGYYAADGMDLLDLFVGSEGTLGIITRLDLRLVPAPAVVWGLMAFLPSTDAAVAFVTRCRGAGTQPAAVEFFDRRALDLLRRQKETNPAFGELPDMPAEWHTGVYIEFHGASEDAVEEAVVDMSDAMADCGGDPDATWLGSDEREMTRLKAFRHAVPEAVNLLIDERRKAEPALTKLGTDLAVPDEALADVMAMYRTDLEAAGLEHVMFGHIGNNHVHVNILPRDLSDYERGKALYLDWAAAVVKMGGTVAAEHGIGKLKKALLAVMFGEAGIEQMRAVKRVFDPGGRLNPGVLFDCAGKPPSVYCTPL
jgi:D-lactate dehydrogenase (cytochrome)